MPRFTRRKFAPYQTDKHYIPKSNATLSSGSISVLDVVTAVARGTVRTAVQQVYEGNTVKAVHLEYWIVGTQAVNSTQFVMIVYKDPSGNSTPTVSNLLNLQSYANKKNILYTTQGNLANNAAGGSIPIIRDWILIPRGKQRMGLGDKISVAITAVGESLNICGMATYKEIV